MGPKETRSPIASPSEIGRAQYDDESRVTDSDYRGVLAQDGPRRFVIGPCGKVYRYQKRHNGAWRNIAKGKSPAAVALAVKLSGVKGGAGDRDLRFVSKITDVEPLTQRQAAEKLESRYLFHTLPGADMRRDDYCRVIATGGSYEPELPLGVRMAALSDAEAAAWRQGDPLPVETEHGLRIVVSLDAEEVHLQVDSGLGEWVNAYSAPKIAYLAWLVGKADVSDAALDLFCARGEVHLRFADWMRSGDIFAMFNGLPMDQREMTFAASPLD